MSRFCDSWMSLSMCECSISRVARGSNPSNIFGTVTSPQRNVSASSPTFRRLARVTHASDGGESVNRIIALYAADGKGSVGLQRPSPPPLQLRRKAHPARPAAGAAHGDEDALLLLVVEVGAFQHGAGLLLEQVVERQVAGDDAVVGGERGGLVGRGAGFLCRFGFLALRHRVPGSSYAGLTRVSMLRAGASIAAARPQLPSRRMDCRVEPGNDDVSLRHLLHIAGD